MKQAKNGKKPKKLRQVQAVVFVGGKILVLKKRDLRLKESFWRLPKGKLEKGENAKEGLKREIKEETGLGKIEIARKVFSYAYESPKGVFRKVECFAVFSGEKPRMTGEGRREGISQIALVSPAEALEKLRWAHEAKGLRKALEAKAKRYI